MRRDRRGDARRPHGLARQAVAVRGQRGAAGPAQRSALLPQYGKLFDRGYVTSDDGGGLLLSPALPESRFDLLGIRPDANPARVPAEQRPLLPFHRNRVFIRREVDE